MKPMISSLSLLAVLAVFATPSALSQTCGQQAAELQSKQSQAQKIADARLVLRDDVEAAGDAWDELEIHRLASAGHASSADEAKAKYERLKADLIEKETDLQARVAALNERVEAYNQRCVKTKS